MKCCIKYVSEITLSHYEKIWKQLFDFSHWNYIPENDVITKKNKI